MERARQGGGGREGEGGMGEEGERGLPRTHRRKMRTGGVWSR